MTNMTEYNNELASWHAYYSAPEKYYFIFNLFYCILFYFPYADSSSCMWVVIRSYMDASPWQFMVNC